MGTQSLPQLSNTSSQNHTHRKECNDKCPICLQDFEIPCLLDKCFHQFCIFCILQWAEITASCPLCKSSFNTFVYDVKSSTDYKIYLYHVDHARNLKKKKSQISIPVQFPLTEAHAKRRLLYYRSGRVIHSELALLFSRLQRDLQSSDSRKKMLLFKAEEWIIRELQALLEEQDVLLLHQFILSLLEEGHTLEKCLEALRPFLFEKTERFVCELARYLLTNVSSIGRYDLMNVMQEDEGVMTQILSENSKKESTYEIEENVNNNNTAIC